jgi:hypothetical protein
MIGYVTWHSSNWSLKSPFIDQKATKRGLFRFRPNGVTWHIKSFSLRQGFQIFSFHEDQNEFHVFRKQKSAFINQKATKSGLFRFSSNGVMWRIKSFSLRPGFLIVLADRGGDRSYSNESKKEKQ